MQTNCNNFISAASDFQFSLFRSMDMLKNHYLHTMRLFYLLISLLCVLNAGAQVSGVGNNSQQDGQTCAAPLRRETSRACA
ncbi:MAG: hypothetical protein ACKOCH_02525, partial [Bacteroidota bacterium]